MPHLQSGANVEWQKEFAHARVKPMALIGRPRGHDCIQSYAFIFNDSVDDIRRCGNPVSYPCYVEDQPSVAGTC